MYSSPYCGLQRVEGKPAACVLDESNHIDQVDPQSFKVAYAVVAIPARYALERRQWKEAAKLTLASGQLRDSLLQHFPWAKAHIHYARAIGAARSGDAAAARHEIDELSRITQALTSGRGD